MEVALGLLYIIIQIFAGVIGSLAFYYLYGHGVPFGPHADTGMELKFQWYQVLLVEFLFTFMLCFTVLNTACCKEGNQYFGLSIGFVIVAGGNAAGWISGGAFNPAVGLGLDISDTASGFGWSMPYVLAQCVGGAVSAAAFRWMRPNEYGQGDSMAPGSARHMQVRPEYSERVCRCTLSILNACLLIDLPALAGEAGCRVHWDVLPRPYSRAQCSARL